MESWTCSPLRVSASTPKQHVHNDVREHRHGNALVLCGFVVLMSRRAEKGCIIFFPFLASKTRCSKSCSLLALVLQSFMLHGRGLRRVSFEDTGNAGWSGPRVKPPPSLSGTIAYYIIIIVGPSGKPRFRLLGSARMSSCCGTNQWQTRNSTDYEKCLLDRNLLHQNMRTHSSRVAHKSDGGCWCQIRNYNTGY